MPASHMAHHPAIDMVSFLIGACIGSFLNVLALRALAGESVFWPPSHCPSCKKNLSIWDNIPLVSYIFLRGKCRFCQGNISWQYPAVELCTAIVFVVLERTFLTGYTPYLAGVGNMWACIAAGIKDWHTHGNLSRDMPFELKVGLFLGMASLACTLIAVTVTDLREKLIPHEITYPSLLIGILFSTVVRGDCLGALAAIGISYILFDFLAYYGLKIYLAMHSGNSSSDNEGDVDDFVDQSCKLEAGQEEEIEVMGGGDAVLSAVMGAYLGWQMLVVALCIGFLVGTLMGIVLLFVEMKKVKLLHKCFIKTARWSVCSALGLGLLVFALGSFLATKGIILSWVTVAQMAGLGALTGALMAVVSVSSGVSKPFPFGPALAIGGFVSMFLVPHWLAFH